MVLLLAMVGCGQDGGNVSDVSGDWSYDWQVNAELHMQGAMNLQQTGDAVTGRISTPPGYPQQWNWDLAGAATDRVVLSAMSADAQLVWTIDVADNGARLDGIAYADGSPSVYTFTATR